jgi:hypothetical protein
MITGLDGCAAANPLLSNRIGGKPGSARVKKEPEADICHELLTDPFQKPLI